MRIDHVVIHKEMPYLSILIEIYQTSIKIVTVCYDYITVLEMLGLTFQLIFNPVSSWKHHAATRTRHHAATSTCQAVPNAPLYGPVYNHSELGLGFSKISEVQKRS